MNHTHTSGHTGSCCNSRGSASEVCQSLIEMEFERGIWYAAQMNDLERVKSLLEKGISSNVEDAAGYTALHYAARNNHYNICKELLQNEANVNATTRSGHATPLHRAASQGHTQIVELLLKFKADVNIVDADNNTALHRAILSQSVPICQLLIPITNLNLINNSDLTPMQLAKEKGYQNILYLFEQNK